MVRGVIWVCATTILLMASVVSAAGLLSMLPGNNTITGWSIIPSYDKHAESGSELVEIYGIQAGDLISAGVVSGASRVYRKGNKRISVDLFQMTTWQNSAQYYNDKRNEIAGLDDFTKTNTIRQEFATATENGTRVAYLWKKEYVCVFVMDGASEADVNAIRSFAAYISGQILD